MYFIRTIRTSDNRPYATLTEMTARELREAEQSKPANVSYERVSAAYAHRWVRDGRIHETLLWIDDGRVRRA